MTEKFLSDIEIAQEAGIQVINDIAKKQEYLKNMWKTTASIKQKLIPFIYKGVYLKS